MDAQDWINKAKERATKAAWKLNSLRSDARFVGEDLAEAKDQLETAARHVDDALRKLKQ